MTKGNKLEFDIESASVKYLRNEGCLVVKLPALLYRGIPDRLVLGPDKTIYFIEFKCDRKGSRVSTAQKFWHNILLKWGFHIYAPKSLAEVKENHEAEKIPKASS